MSNISFLYQQLATIKPKRLIWLYFCLDHQSIKELVAFSHLFQPTRIINWQTTHRLWITRLYDYPSMWNFWTYNKCFMPQKCVCMHCKLPICVQFKPDMPVIMACDANHIDDRTTLMGCHF